MSEDRPHDWLDRLIHSPTLGEVCRAVEGDVRGRGTFGGASGGGVFRGRGVEVRGSQGSSTNLLAGALAVRAQRLVLLVVAHLDDAEDALEDLALFDGPAGGLKRRVFGALETLPGETGVSLELLAQRLRVVRELVEAGRRGGLEGGVLIAPVQALMQAVPEPDTLGELSLTIESGQNLPTAVLFEWLTRVGYQRVEAIEQPGDFAGRGGIVDIYPPVDIPDDAAGASDDLPGVGPIRLDYFGDEVESIRRIDPDTMGSGIRVQRVHVMGATADQVQSDTRTTNLLSLLPEPTVVVMHEVMELAEQARGYYERLTNPVGVYPPQAVFKTLNTRPHVQVNQYSRSAGGGGSGGDSGGGGVVMPVRPLVSFAQDAAEAVRELAGLAGGDVREPRDDAGEAELRKAGSGATSGATSGGVVVMCQQAAERDRLLELIREHAPESEAQVRVYVGYLHRGFVWDPAVSGSDGDVNLTSRGHLQNKTGRGGSSLSPDPAGAIYWVPHHELFHRYHVRRRLRSVTGGSAGTSGRAGGRVSDVFLDMDVGDYVVHADHGIARFTGLGTMKRRGGLAGSEEYLTLEFANKALLHVPATQIDLVQRYVGGFQGKPPLSLLGGRRWAKQKQQVAEAVEDLAIELLRVQASRSSLPGIRYPADTAWQREFEAEFPYEETEDQLAAIAKAKTDMADEQPMDRLICGDVGFGKTEVAVRAAFKAVEFGKQVAVLVPTTVLAEQHERTFGDRMADYPFRVESISRFKTARQVTQVLKALALGEVDVVIGTHRLLSKDVRFADLGLVIIDEEQRFGVQHKQKLMRFRMTVDVLTLSATPIPRTLHMAMLGLRDISSLSSPPLDRRAIVTEVIPYDAARITQAIHRELNREGQVYFVHNRVHNIQSVADELQRLVPGARVLIGHGQMPGRDLEKVMLKFFRRQADILVCTTIIESGIDNPIANTMFINMADHFGLAELHQLRGRVGRYKHRAYCYLLLPPDRPITDTASRRLRAVEQYSMLGAGFKIAMRDLEIRGAGNLLGPQQSGHIAAVGYEMYCQLLEQAARRLRCEQVIEPVRTHLELPTTGQLPKSYIGSDKFRMEAYRRLGRATTLEQLDAIAADMEDAYGPPPPPAQVMVDLAQLRIAATTLGLEAIKLDGPDVILRTDQPQRLDRVMSRAPGTVRVVDDRTLYFRPPANYLEPRTLLAVLRKLLVTPLRGQPHADQVAAS